MMHCKVFVFKILLVVSYYLQMHCIYINLIKVAHYKQTRKHTHTHIVFSYNSISIFICILFYNIVLYY